MRERGVPRTATTDAPGSASSEQRMREAKGAQAFVDAGVPVKGHASKPSALSGGLQAAAQAAGIPLREASAASGAGALERGRQTRSAVSNEPFEPPDRIDSPSTLSNPELSGEDVYVCDTCGGEGIDHGEVCSTCDGSGRVPASDGETPSSVSSGEKRPKVRSTLGTATNRGYEPNNPTETPTSLNNPRSFGEALRQGGVPLRPLQ